MDPDMRGSLAARLTAGAAAVCALLASGCSGRQPPAIQVERNLVVVDNRTSGDWLQVEIWINRQYRVTAPRIAARSRFTAPLDVFVAGFGQRFDRRKQRIDDLRLKAKASDGGAVEIVYRTPKSGLAGALEGFGS
jgi:hypothetical protein